ncbi:hypothetical protein ACOMHN_055119 [Nucella lapillus]
MGKISKLMICGHTGVGKSAIVEQLLYGNHVVESPSHSTIEDIYTAVIETDRGVKEKVCIFDTGAAAMEGADADLPKHYLNFPDGFILVYDITSWESFRRLDKLKKDIDKHRDKREVHTIVLGNKSEVTERRQVQFDTAQAWASKEKLRHWDVSVANRKSLVDPFPPSKTNFLPGRKIKSTSGSNLDTS